MQDAEELLASHERRLAELEAAVAHLAAHIADIEAQAERDAMYRQEQNERL